jgi:hypothetical protein
VQTELLDVHKDLDVRVYAVWFEMFPGDSQERWPAAALTDRRVTHYWDEEKDVGSWYGVRLDAMRPQLAPNSRGVEPPLWDAYLVYGPESRWAEAPTELRRWGRTILSTQQHLREEFEALSRPGK